MDVDTLDASLRDVHRAFADAGYPITEPVRAFVRAGLRAEATTLRDGDGFLVLMSDRAAASEDVRMILAHEMGHVQRMASEHASHDDDALTAAYDSVGDALGHDYQRAIAHRVLNHTQDLYADPVSIRVSRSAGFVDDERLDRLMLGFANDEPYAVEDPLERRWDRAEDMVGNARVIALARLAALPSAEVRARDMQARYLARIEPDIAEHAPWFEARLLDLPEDVTRTAFAEILVGLLTRFVRVANGNA